MDLIRKIPKKFTKKFGNKVINRQYFRRKTGNYVLFFKFCMIQTNESIMRDLKPLFETDMSDSSYSEFVVRPKPTQILC